MAWSDILKQLPNQDRQRLGALDSATKQLISMYLTAHDEIATFLQKGLSTNATQAQVAQWAVQAANSGNNIGFITDRIIALDSQIGSLLRTSATNLLNQAYAQAPTYFNALGISVKRPLADATVIENSIPAALSRITDWNRQWRKEILANVRLSYTLGETYDQAVARIDASGSFAGKSTPVARVQAHSMANVRYALIRANNDAREQAYTDIATTSEIQVRKVWWAAIGTCCRSCALMHGTIVDLNQDFPWEDKGLSITPIDGTLAFPPLHPNCRCRILPVTVDIEPMIRRSLTSRASRLRELAAA